MERIRVSSGLTILEVLVASIVFMIGAGTTAYLISLMRDRYSLNDQVEALNLARSSMERTLAANEFTDTAYVEHSEGLAYRIERFVTMKDGLACIRINVVRAIEGKLLITLYDERYIR